MKRESKLDVLWNNAGVSRPPLGSVSRQGFEFMMATNCLGPLLFTQLLLLCLKTTAKASSPGSVRVVWTSSQYVDLQSPKGGIIMSEVKTATKDKAKSYGASKIGNWFWGSEMARKVGQHGIVSIIQNPGNLKTNLMRHAKWMYSTVYPILHMAKMGAFTELFAGLSPEISMEHNRGYVIPWGRIHDAPRKDLLVSLKSVEEGGNGRAEEFWNWCEKQIAKYK
ncbi:b86a53f4-b5a4-4f7b-9b49-e6b352e90a27 [Sclerotinia trifoliorum]|uniref:B86a53f4-b5a4-4f7b-9b49-e6b352e90a27 n=1 Tax=Sclerotinia trifoliorum TaxID=28548 RepID=A0A8H2VMB0_9HELO|nr:b86a53f4-b5a4-4f7b-9b49-e6b352e90a27 [Sclerotinia trifoliorum]